jgi:predicted ATPase
VFRFGERRPALGSIPEDVERFPLSIQARNLLRDIKTFALTTQALRRPAPSRAASSHFDLDGANMPHVVHALRQRDPVLFEDWVAHVATGVPGLSAVDVWERDEDRSLVLRAYFHGDHAEPVPTWLLSDGTLRMMALSLLSYAASPGDRSLFLLEEPENGLHPLAIQTVYQALTSAPPGVQILCASHSPVMLSHVRLDEALVFRRTRDGSAIVRHRDEDPELAGWSGRANVADLFATGVLA